MTSKRLQYIIHMIGLILVMIMGSMKILDYQVPKILAYSIVLIAAVYIFLLFKNRYER